MLQERLLNREASKAFQHSFSEALLHKLDIESLEPSVMFMNLPIGSLFEKAIMTLLLIFASIERHRRHKKTSC